jgi:hypothetical protein
MTLICAGVVQQWSPVCSFLHAVAALNAELCKISGFFCIDPFSYCVTSCLNTPKNAPYQQFIVVHHRVRCFEEKKRTALVKMPPRFFASSASSSFQPSIQLPHLFRVLC